MNDWIKDIFDFWKLIIIELNNWYGLIGAIILILIIGFVFATFKNQINKKSIQEINKNNDRKYISDLYVELGNTHELLRYFVLKEKWYKRLKSNFYILFNNHLGNLLEKYSKIKISKYTKNKNLYKNIQETQKAVTSIRKYNFDDHDNLLGFLSHHVYSYRDELQDLIDAGNLINKRVCFVLGEAGSGKTNLMTRLSKVIIENYKKHCVYINAKTVTDNNDIEKKFNEFFYTKMLINEHSSQRIRTYLSLLSLTTERIFVIVEAVNENENPNFMMDLVNFINKYSKYKKLNFIITTRSEFFKIKYEQTIIDNLLVDYEIININNNRFSELTLDRMMEKYNKHYNFTGQINNSVARMIRRSPIIMRMFYECYENSSENVNDLTRFQLFNYYIEKLRQEYSKINFWNMLYDIVECMIKNEKYDYIKYDDLKNPKEISDTLVYENVLLDKSITIDESKITQEVEYVIAFTYDEMRDFIISKYLIKEYGKKKKELIKFLNNCKKNNSSILEGILRYLYLHFKSEKNYALAKEILNNYAKGNYVFPKHNRNSFRDLGLEIIFQQYQKLEIFEVDYILKNNFMSDDTAFIIVNLIGNTLNNIEPNADIFMHEINKSIKDSSYSSNLLNLDIEFYRNIIKNLREVESSKQAKANIIINILKKWLNQDGE